ncbi:hypothetical protein PTSG_09533 [Salpingoeca rosetta]|uniref:Uncharacterized protein n=1 Tax=Salpingoeca rosetta (strain ATCC 50818 / BSB-021) TaxID=946362 RepID=F2UL99_SALR5|nr:uncharacterized protein PTSG_09533 [Salpingoeca rosetta]EGD77898.1 hypothetical protein PTSG_09533 [Salpingoeca rosetta]|eukprot:XP_004989962.1 hypothetical protein PTSG_09533 [Salpingoeca rosetta]
MMAFGGWVGVSISVVLLLHAAYSASRYHSYLKINHEEFESLPIDIVVQTVAAMIVGMVAIVALNTNFADIHLTSRLKSKTWETACPKAAFRTFHNTRHSLIHNKAH